jgi:hypothetical protein
MPLPIFPILLFQFFERCFPLDASQWPENLAVPSKLVQVNLKDTGALDLNMALTQESLQMHDKREKETRIVNDRSGSRNDISFSCEGPSLKGTQVMNENLIRRDSSDAALVKLLWTLTVLAAVFPSWIMP